jgi:hypothetical protein
LKKPRKNQKHDEQVFHLEIECRIQGRYLYYFLLFINYKRNFDNKTIFLFNSRSKSPIAVRSGSAGRSVSPFSQKSQSVKLVNPTSLLAPGAIDPSTSNIIEEEQPKRQAKWDIPPDTSTIGAAQPGKSLSLIREFRLRNSILH